MVGNGWILATGLDKRAAAVGCGELVFLDCCATALGFLRGLRRCITQVNSKARSIGFPVGVECT